MSRHSRQGAARHPAPRTAAATAATDAGGAATTAAMEAFQHQLQALASPDVAAGQDAYFKHVIKHRGIKAPAVDAACKAFLRDCGNAADPAALRWLAWALLREPLQVGLCRRAAGWPSARRVRLRAPPACRLPAPLAGGQASGHAPAGARAAAARRRRRLP